MEEQLYSLCQFLGPKTIGKKNLFPNFWFQEMSLKREIFVNFLPQNFMKKYGIVSTYSITCVSQNFFDVSSVSQARIGRLGLAASQLLATQPTSPQSSQ